MGQYIQEGLRNLFETVISVDKPRTDLRVPRDPDDLDGLNYLAGKTMDFVNKKAFEGTLLAHVDGGVPNLVVRLPEVSPYTYGQLVYFFEKACGISGYLLGVNPFDQPGVEAYKRNMFALLGKPGFEDEGEALEKAAGEVLTAADFTDWQGRSQRRSSLFRKRKSRRNPAPRGERLIPFRERIGPIPHAQRLAGPSAARASAGGTVSAAEAPSMGFAHPPGNKVFHPL